jgi:hypothetical protein
MASGTLGLLPLAQPSLLVETNFPFIRKLQSIKPVVERVLSRF